MQIMKKILNKKLLVHFALPVMWFVGFLFFYIDRYVFDKQSPAGLITVATECLLELAAIICFFSFNNHNRKKLKYFLIFFCFLLPADFSYLIIHYLLKLPNSFIAFSFTTLLYSVGYSFACIGFWQHIRKSFHTAGFIAIIWLPLLFAIPVLFEILVPLMFTHYKTGGFTFLLLELIFNSIFAMSFFFLAVLVFAFSLDKTFSLLAIGGVVIQLGNWGIYSTLLTGDRYSLTEYEFLWLCGVIATSYDFFGLKNNPTNNAVIGDETYMPDRLSSGKSLVIQQRQIIIGIISVSLLVAVNFLHQDVGSFRIVFFGVAIGCFVALILGELLAHQIIHYAALFGRTIHRTDQHENDMNMIPVELQKVYQIAFQNDVIQRRLQSAISEKLNNLAVQVAHDIRSPLSALDSMASRVALLPEDDRIVIRSAVNRIKDIANSLIEKNRHLKESTLLTSSDGPTTDSNSDSASNQLLSGLIDPLITEKRNQYRSKINIDIDFRIDDSSYGIFARVNSREFKRVLSNLIDNAVEALPGRGKVSVLLRMVNKQIEITIADNGKGIPAEVLTRLGQRGETHGKEGRGSGLGLCHARTWLDSWGGSLQIQSEVDRGTSVILQLPTDIAPEWFVSELLLFPSNAVVILDDDISVHQIWQSRFDEMKVKNAGIVVYHLSTPDELTAWIRDFSDVAKTALFLADYELLGHKQTGLNLIETFNVGPQSILVTSRYEEKQIMAECRRLGVRLIPKGLAGFVPVRIDDPSAPIICDAVLIDDDAMIRRNWSLNARVKGKNLITFGRVEDFFARSKRIALETPIFIDSNLGEGIRGEEISRKIYDLGFRTIYLETGFEAESFPKMDHLCGIIGKGAPDWESLPVRQTRN